ncbi:MAG TPA: hypothetical protein DHV14_14565 [Micrococcales bacterium]|nr:hypothetical protein [Micrococcales bacterium]
MEDKRVSVRTSREVERMINVGRTAPPVVSGFPASVVSEAVRRLTERNADLSRLAHRPPRPARWRQAPSAKLSWAPVIAADEAEVAIVAILSATRGQWLFSLSSKSRMYTHSRHGWAKNEEDRTYVAGLSEIIDTVGGVIESHRGGGGRVYLTRHVIQCAECRLVIASIEEPHTTGPKAVGRCSASRRR